MDVTVIITTGNANVAEGQILCRVLFIGHSAKTFYAEGRSRQRETLGIDFFAECLALGTAWHSTKRPYAEG
jgi:hypothetical protein